MNHLNDKFLSASNVFLSIAIKDKMNATYPLHHGTDWATSKPGNNEPWLMLKMLKNGLKNGSFGRLKISLSLELGLESPIVPETTSKPINNTKQIIKWKKIVKCFSSFRAIIYFIVESWQLKCI